MAATYSFVFASLFGTGPEIEAFLKQEAEEATKEWPQYRGKFEAYRLGRVKRTIRTKLGTAAEKGDLVIFKVEEDCDPRFAGNLRAVFWSRANRCDTSVAAKDVEAAS